MNPAGCLWPSSAALWGREASLGLLASLDSEFVVSTEELNNLWTLKVRGF